MRKEAESLKNHKVKGTDLEIKLVAFPTLTGQLLASYFIIHYHSGLEYSADI